MCIVWIGLASYAVAMLITIIGKNQTMLDWISTLVSNNEDISCTRISMFTFLDKNKNFNFDFIVARYWFVCLFSSYLRWHCKRARFCDGAHIFSCWYKLAGSCFKCDCYQSRTRCNGHQQLNQFKHIWYSSVLGHSMVFESIFWSRSCWPKLGKNLQIFFGFVYFNFYFYCISFIQQIVLNSSGITYSAISLLSTLVGLYVALALNRFKLDWKIGVTCLCMYVSFLAFASVIELNVFFPVNLPTCPH